MDLITKLQYHDTIKTPELWEGNNVYEFEQISLQNYTEINSTIPFKSQRLGKRVEEFIFHQLQQDKSINWICDNLQIQNGKQTIGEIDALYYKNAQPIHLEIVYKFYLYDTNKDYSNSLAYWIGPNRNDSLIHKLDKLKNKQLPLLYNALTQPYLKKLNLNLNNIKQKLCFKAQLFLPFNNRTLDVLTLNTSCIAGFFISYKNIETLKAYFFYCPVKLDWLIKPHDNVNWMPFNTGLELIEQHINNKRSPLVWLKSNTGDLHKCFITFW